MGRIISYDSQMEKDWYSIATCKIYWYIYWKAMIVASRSNWSIEIEDVDVLASAPFLMDKLNIKSNKTVFSAIDKLLEDWLICKSRDRRTWANIYNIVDSTTYSINVSDKMTV